MQPEPLGESTVVVAAEIREDDKKVQLEEYILEELGGTKLTESVYEFDFDECDVEWDAILKAIKDIIDNRSDTVLLWDLAVPEDAEEYELYRTKVGK